MYDLNSVIKKEYTYFLRRTSNSIRRLVLSDTFKTASNPLVTTFLNAFIWRLTGSLIPITVYNIGMVISLPLAFYINGLSLRYIHIRWLFTGGAILSSLANIVFVFFGSSNTPAIFICGCIWGLGTGFYWANRNYLEFKETFSGARLYFYGIIQSISSIASIFVSFVAGWFVAFGDIFHLYSTTHAYWALFAFSIMLMLFCASIILNGAFESPIPHHVSLKVRPILNERRILNVASGFSDATPFIPTLLILIILGNEGILGSITAMVSLATGILLYVYGRQTNPNSELRTVFVSGMLFFVSGFFLIMLPSKIGAISYVLSYGIATSFLNVAVSPVLLSLSEDEMPKDVNSRYSFIFDNELFLNFGRLISLLIVVGLVFLTSELTTLIYGQILMGLLYIIFLLIFFKLRSHRKKRKANTSFQCYLPS